MFSALLTLTQLTCLQLPTVVSTSGSMADLLLWPPASDTTSALHLLGCLTRLHTLNLGHRYTVYDADAIALERLPQLANLQVRCLQLSSAAGGRLRTLQHLDLARHLPTALLRTLLPLLPLQALTNLSSGNPYKEDDAVGAHVRRSPSEL